MTTSQSRAEVEAVTSAMPRGISKLSIDCHLAHNFFSASLLKNFTKMQPTTKKPPSFFHFVQMA